MLAESQFLEGIDAIIPVPLHISKKRIRGFNQSDLICKGLSEVTRLPVDYTSLQRITKTATQTKRSRYERWINVEGIFSVSDAEHVKGKHFLLVDDVITTGSTIESCANELLKYENVKVSVAAIAVAVT